MEMYNVTLEVTKREPMTPDQVEGAMTRLSDYHPVVTMSARGWQSTTITLPAESVVQAFAGAVALAEAAFEADVLAVEVMTTAEFDARQGWAPMPDLVSVSEAAELLGLARQEVLEQIVERTLPAVRVGDDWVLARAAVEVS